MLGLSWCANLLLDNLHHLTLLCSALGWCRIGRHNLRLRRLLVGLGLLDCYHLVLRLLVGLNWCAGLLGLYHLGLLGLGGGW